MADPQPPGSPPAFHRIVRCTACGGESVYAPSNPHRPFCSARCRGVDLGAWASEGYRVAASPSIDPDDDEAGRIDPLDPPAPHR